MIPLAVSFDAPGFAAPTVSSCVDRLDVARPSDDGCRRVSTGRRFTCWYPLMRSTPEQPT